LHIKHVAYFFLLYQNGVWFWVRSFLKYIFRSFLCCLRCSQRCFDLLATHLLKCNFLSPVRCATFITIVSEPIISMCDIPVDSCSTFIKVVFVLCLDCCHPTPTSTSLLQSSPPHSDATVPTICSHLTE
jgi:hypothetical protein